MYMTMRNAVIPMVVSLDAIPRMSVRPMMRSAAISRRSTARLPPIAMNRSLNIPPATRLTKSEGDPPSMNPLPEGVANPSPMSLSKKGHSIIHPIAMRRTARKHSPFPFLSIDLKSMIG